MDDATSPTRRPDPHTHPSRIAPPRRPPSATADNPPTNGAPAHEPSTIICCHPDRATPSPAQPRIGLDRCGGAINRSFECRVASTATTDPTGSTAAHTDAEHATDTTEVTLAVDGSAEPTSPEAEAFCAAELAAEVAVTFEDEAQHATVVDPRHDRSRPGQDFSSLRKAIGVKLLSLLAESR